MPRTEKSGVPKSEAFGILRISPAGWAPSRGSFAREARTSHDTHTGIFTQTSVQKNVWAEFPLHYTNLLFREEKGTLKPKCLIWSGSGPPTGGPWGSSTCTPTGSFKTSSVCHFRESFKETKLYLGGISRDFARLLSQTLPRISLRNKHKV